MTDSDNAPDTAASEPDPQRRNTFRGWRIPATLFGRARTSTVILGICFVLTGLLYNQLQSDNRGVQQGPQPIDPAQYQTTPVEPSVSEYSRTPTAVPTPTEDPSTTTVPPAVGETSGETGAPTSGSNSSTTQDPTFLPGRTIPPELRSLIPPAPPAPSATGTP